MLAIPAKRYQRGIVSYLATEEIDALLAAPDRSGLHGRRDHALLRGGAPDRQPCMPNVAAH